MSALGRLLGLPEDKGFRADEPGLRSLFSWYLAKRLPYETLSNILARSFIRDPREIAEGVRDGFGGHCVEHALLLAALLCERGFDAVYVNGDHRDVASGITWTMAKPFALVTIGTSTFVCDAFYRAILLTAPGAGEAGREAIEVASEPGQIRIQIRRGGSLVQEETIDPRSRLEHRRRQFEERYAGFSPFGITAPFYQTIRPERRGLYYDPDRDTLVAHDRNAAWAVADDQLGDLTWIPRRLVDLIPAALPSMRRERERASAFLDTGLYVPYYRLLRGGPARSGEPARPRSEI